MRSENGFESSHNSNRRPSNPLSNGSATSALSSPLKNPDRTNGSSTDAVTNGHSTDKPIGPYFAHDREEVTRILIQGLSDLGYKNAAATLVRESGFELELPSVAAFRAAIHAGEWSEAEALLFGTEYTLRQKTTHSSSSHTYTPGLPLSDSADHQDMLFLMRQQKYLEMLESRNLDMALVTLRSELTPLHQDVMRLHFLSSLIMCDSAEELRAQAQWDGAAGDSRNHLLAELSKSISPSVMIPEHRLAVLLDQVQDQQIRQCLYHNTTRSPSLYHDHECDREDFPMHLYQDLREHTDEVWYLEFSHDGSMLASAGKDNKVVIYSTTNWRSIWQFQENHDMGSSDTGICYISWSPDDRYLLSCSQAKEMVLYDTRTGHKIGTIDHFTYPVTTAAWAPDGSSFVVGSQDSARPLGLYEFPSQENVYTWLSEDEVSMRINDCSISANGSRLAAITSDSRVLVYNFQTREKIAEWSMEDRLTCVSLSSNGQSLLVSMNEGRLMLLDSETGHVTQRYSGLRQSEFVIRSAFGGANENFVISGSEDSCVYIWRTQTGQLVASIEAHNPGTVNCVAWHPTNFAIFASAGDDNKVKIWSNSQTVRRRSSGQGIGWGLGDNLYSR